MPSETKMILLLNADQQEALYDLQFKLFTMQADWLHQPDGFTPVSKVKPLFSWSKMR